MRFPAFALAASVLVLGACGGNKDQAAGEGAATDTSGMGGTATAPGGTDPAAPGAATGAPPAGGAVAAMPANGTTHEVKMLGDEKGYRFEPANITVKQGDAIKFTMVSGGPHNVAFDPAGIPAAGKDQLNANIPNQASELSSQMLMNPNEAVTISFAGVAPGTYNYHCTPHLAMNMKGVITVQ
jgi:plastocyanin